MKIKLIRCQICMDWYSPIRNHCPVCSAARVHMTDKSFTHVNSRTGRQMVTVVSRYNFNNHLAAIARVLAGGNE